MGFELNLDAQCFVGKPCLTPPELSAHKYVRGHAVVVSGPVLRTGASRLSAHAALAVGAGLVTIVGEADALREQAAHVTAVMLRPRDALFGAFDPRISAIAIGPGAGVGVPLQDEVLHLAGLNVALVLDADALTAFEKGPERLFAKLHPQCVLTPHHGEFRRLFPRIVSDDRSKAAAQSARLSGSVVLLKGAQTIIAAPDGRIAINRHASPWLATAGSGDVLTGLITGLLAQGIAAFDAACIAAWLHGDMGVRAGPGLTADRMLDQLPLVLRGCLVDAAADDSRPRS